MNRLKQILESLKARNKARFKSTVEKQLVKEAEILKASKNPYIQSRLMWNDLYGDLQSKLENAYRIIVVLCMVLAIAMIGFVVIAGQSRVKPYLTVLHGNTLLTTVDSQSDSFGRFKPKLAQLLTKQFLEAARTVSVDHKVNQSNSLKTYAFVRGAATQVLQNFYTKHNPDVIAKNQIRSIHLTSLLVRSEHTFDLRWQEEVRDVRTGIVMESEPYSAEVTFAFAEPSKNEVIASINPMGFYIEQVIWSKDAR